SSGRIDSCRIPLSKSVYFPKPYRCADGDFDYPKQGHAHIKKHYFQTLLIQSLEIMFFNVYKFNSIMEHTGFEPVTF
ncbi:hypothetical protein AB1I66_23715, partial [[Clostridium] symbiosum]